MERWSIHQFKDLSMSSKYHLDNELLFVHVNFASPSILPLENKAFDACLPAALRQLSAFPEKGDWFPPSYTAFHNRCLLFRSPSSCCKRHGPFSRSIVQVHSQAYLHNPLLLSQFLIVPGDKCSVKAAFILCYIKQIKEKNVTVLEILA